MLRYEKNKYGAKRCRCMNNHMHDSKGEAGYCNDLTLRTKAGDIAEFEIQKTFILHDKNGKRISAHRVDFVVTYFNGKKEIHEYKGCQTEIWKLKKRLTEVEYPEIPYIVIWHK